MNLKIGKSSIRGGLLASFFLLVVGACFSPVASKPHASGSSSTDVAGQPTVMLPGGMVGRVTVETSSYLPPAVIDTRFRTLGSAYEVNLNGNKGWVSFGSQYAVLSFPYDKTKLAANGLGEEFAVFYYDTVDEAWRPVDKVEVDSANSRILAYTSHFTTFVATSVVPAVVPSPPDGIMADYPGGIVGGSGSAKFTVVGQGFTYYQDRTYYVRPVSSSTINQTTFTALGFDGALGIATRNGDDGTPTPQVAHKHYTGNDYITFTTLRDLDVYVMYDTRGGTSANDLSKDAPRLASYGFTADIATPTYPTPTRYFVETTDSVGRYKVYKKTYLTGQVVHLDGNQKGVADLNIDTNYWVIVKKKDDYSSNSASSVAVSPSDITPPGEVSNLTAKAGNGHVVLTWTSPADGDLSQFYFSYSPGGTTPLVGAAPGDAVDITGLTNGTSYVFTIKTVDASHNVSAGASVSMTPNNIRKMTYEGNGNTAGSVPVDPVSYLAGQTASVLDKGTLARTGYDFNGWNTQPDGTGTAYSPGAGYVLGSIDPTLYAQWIVTKTDVAVSVTLNLGDDDPITTTLANKVVRGALLSASVAETFDTYQWYLDNNVTVVGSARTVAVDTSNLVPGLHTLMVVALKNGAYSSHSVKFTVENPTGIAVSVHLTVGSDVPITTTVPSMVARGANLNVSVAETFDTYQWYLDNGAALVGTTKMVSVATGSLAPGLHVLAAVVSKNGSYSSANVRFTVGVPTGMAVKVSLTVGSEDLVSVAAPVSVAKGTALNVSTAQNFDTYHWYVDDGTNLVGSAKSISVATGGMVPGLHSLMAVVSKSGNFTSISYRFKVTN